MSMLSDDFSLSAAECSEKVSIGVLRQLLYDQKFGAAEVDSEETLTAAKHLNNGCPSCMRRTAFLNWTDPVLKTDAETVIKSLAEKIQVRQILEDEKLKQHAADLERELKETGSLAGADASLRRSLVDHLAKESALTDPIGVASYIISDLNRLRFSSEAEKGQATHRYRQLYEAARITNPGLEQKIDTLFFTSLKTVQIKALPPNELYFAVLYVASLPGILELDEVPISIKEGKLSFSPEQILHAPFSANEMQ